MESRWCSRRTGTASRASQPTTTSYAESSGSTGRRYALNDRGDDSPEGELTDGILDPLAKFERAKITERTRRGRLQKAREGKVMAGRSLRYGFGVNASRDGYEVDEDKVRVVRRIFCEVAEGTTLRAIKLKLESEGVPTPRGVGFWDRSFFRNCILDDVYRPHSFEEAAAVVSWRSQAAWTPPGATGCGGSIAAR